MKKIKFKRNFTPYKQGEEIEVGKDFEIKIAEYYVSLGVAFFLCNCEDDDKEPCLGCGQKAKKQAKKTVNKAKAKTKEDNIV